MRQQTSIVGGQLMASVGPILISTGLQQHAHLVTLVFVRQRVLHATELVQHIGAVSCEASARRCEGRRWADEAAAVIEQAADLDAAVEALRVVEPGCREGSHVR